MIQPASLYKWLVNHEVEFFSGVPDSLLKDICAYITDNAPKENHIIAANEGNAVALAAGHHMATGKVPMVYMQNSGIGNAVNPLLSLTDRQVYQIPLLLMIGWRGEPGVKDEPQHVTQGEVTISLLEAMKIPYKVLSMDEGEAKQQVAEAVAEIKASSEPLALIVKKGTFAGYKIKEGVDTNFELSREQAIQQIVRQLQGDEVIISTTGKTSRELFEIREAMKQPHHFDFLTVGCMGHASQIALGIALSKPDKKVICIDGDGALLMHMGAMAITGSMKPKNFVHIVVNNGSHESVGGQPTVGLTVDVPTIAMANNYASAISVETVEELQVALANMSGEVGPALIEIKVKVGSRDDLGRPTIKPVDNKKDFMKNLAQK
jgi:phosphonopyruvate decarboxylase